MSTSITTSDIGVNNNETVYNGTATSSFTEYKYARNQNYLRIQNKSNSNMHIKIETDGQSIIYQGQEKVFHVELLSFEIKGGGDFIAVSKNDVNLHDEVSALKAAIENGGAGGGLTTGQVETIVDGKMGALVSPVTATLNMTTPVSPYAVEVGNSVTPVLPWTIANSSNAKSAKIVETTNSNATIVSPTVAASGTYTFGSALSSNSVTAKSYRLDVTDKLDRVISSTVRTINWYYPVFNGSSAKASGLTESEVKAFNKAIRASASGTYNFGAVSNTYKWLFVHESFNPKSFKAGGFDMPMQEPITITITNEFGVSLNLKGYRTTNSTSGAIDLVVA